MRKTFTWDNGDSLYADFSGAGNGAITFSSDTNQGCDRSKTLTVKTTKGGNKQQSIVVNQVGLRTPLMCTDGVFTLSTGGTFNILKDEIR